MVLTTERLLLEPITLPLVEAMLAGDRRAAEAAANAQLPELWPGAALVERAQLDVPGDFDTELRTAILPAEPGTMSMMRL